MAKDRGKIHTICECALFSALICVLSPFVVPIGPVPVSLSLFAVMFTGSVLSVRKSMVAVVVYILAGSVGIPVFAGFQGGFSQLLSPTGGYIWSYFAVALVVSACAKKGLWVHLTGGFLSLVVCYVSGTLWYMFLTDTRSLVTVLTICVIPFVPFDIIKTFAAIVLGRKVKHTLIKQNLL